MEICRTNKTETHTFTKALATVEASWLLMEIASYHFVNWSPLNRVYLFPLDSVQGSIMSKRLLKRVTWVPCCQAVYAFLVWRLHLTAYFAKTYPLVNIFSHSGPVESFRNSIKRLGHTKMSATFMKWNKQLQKVLVLLQNVLTFAGRFACVCNNSLTPLLFLRQCRTENYRWLTYRDPCQSDSPKLVLSIVLVLVVQLLIYTLCSRKNDLFLIKRHCFFSKILYESSLKTNQS